MTIRVLVVEDQPKILKAQIKLLETFEEIAIVGEALSGESALEKVEEVRPEVILLDLGLPQMSGIDVTKRVKATHPEIEILIFTIFDEEDKVIEAIAAGAAGYLLKGTPVEKIVEAIKDVKAGGAVIQPNLARALLRLIGKKPGPRPPSGTAPRPPSLPAAGGSGAAGTTPVLGTPSPGGMAGDTAMGDGMMGAVPESDGEEETASVLTDRELEILQIIAKGLSNNEAAKVLGLSKATIRTHLEHIYEKLDVTNRVEAVTEGIRQGIINI
jgi:DNA-binding NarL/FixJ family response regulator